MVPCLAPASFQGILFDTYPMTIDEVHCQHYRFFKHARRLLSPGGIFTYYSDETQDFSPRHRKALHDAGFSDDCISGEICPVETPLSCMYWRAPTLLSPVIIRK